MDARHAPRPAATILALTLLATAVAAPRGLRAQEAAAADSFAAARHAMVRDHLASPRPGAPAVTDEGVLAAMRSVPRHAFVPEAYRHRAYGDHPLPIGYDQTISQPYIVARMTELLELEPGEKVLEVGTGSGYQAAVLAEITDSVFSVEIREELASAARERLERLGYGAVRVRHGDGYLGWPEHAPFDAVVVTAAPREVPGPLVEQLARGGRLVIPVGPRNRVQQLLILEKQPDGSVTRRTVTWVRFVPLIRDTAGRHRGGPRATVRPDPTATVRRDGPARSGVTLSGRRPILTPPSRPVIRAHRQE